MRSADNRKQRLVLCSDDDFSVETVKEGRFNRNYTCLPRSFFVPQESFSVERMKFMLVPQKAAEEEALERRQKTRGFLWKKEKRAGHNRKPRESCCFNRYFKGRFLLKYDAENGINRKVSITDQETDQETRSNTVKIKRLRADQRPGDVFMRGI